MDERRAGTWQALRLIARTRRTWSRICPTGEQVEDAEQPLGWVRCAVLWEALLVAFCRLDLESRCLDRTLPPYLAPPSPSP